MNDYMKTKSVSTHKTLADDLTDSELKALATWNEEPSYLAIKSIIERLTIQKLKILIAGPIDTETDEQFKLRAVDCKARYEEVSKFLLWPEVAKAKLKEHNVE
jgi:hypothetical protein